MHWTSCLTSALRPRRWVGGWTTLGSLKIVPHELGRQLMPASRDSGRDPSLPARNAVAGAAVRVTPAVEGWAAEQGLSDAEDLLGRYGRAYEERRAAALSDLCDVAKAADGRRSLVSLLNRSDIADSERLLTLDALDGQIDSMDIGSIVGAVINQRPQLAVAAAELIARVPSGETLFCLTKVLGARGDDVDAEAFELAAQLRSSASPATPRDALFFALAAPDDDVDSELVAAWERSSLRLPKISIMNCGGQRPVTVQGLDRLPAADSRRAPQLCSPVCAARGRRVGRTRSRHALYPHVPGAGT